MFTRQRIEPGQKYADRLYRNEYGDSLKTLVVMDIVEGERFDHHPQLKYAKCRVEYANGNMGITFVALHRLLMGRFYKLLPK